MVEWDFGEHPISNEEIQEVENTLQVKFPKDYLKYVKSYSGATPTPETFDFEGRKGIAFGYLHSFHEDSESYIINVSNRYRDGRMPDKVIPIADDVFGNEICFDFRKNHSNPPLVFWDHEIAFENPESALSHICNSFTELVDKLYEE
ncbi:SMI1/KNR4 family protein [Bacillus velezensis]|uniref:SMI1/KNR4 family protein n=1 Tax=Bacillus velezensis TaxID=492670 RepID=UPI0006A62E8D|nr:SMI1/KNR4 family protein [Bacillus velezensis]KOC79049.1 hypothetical protein AKJ10_19130 [Bacillus velezensis]KSW04510.1 hypothetical protein AR442_16715 [Bacillus velezensis]MEC3674293.1 SMI1/KNR4 family protein [Bacillus velezensis]TKZ16998.1 SMI1/KNR4 family protein [Bacillus velezensis]